MHWYKSILLGAAAGLCLVLVVEDSNIIVRKPFGLKMCDQLCNRIAGCSKFKFVLSDFSCHIKNVTSNQQDVANGIFVRSCTKDEEKINAETAMNCSQDEKIFYTRQHIIKCRPRLHRPPSYIQDDTRPDEMTRLLMLPCSLDFNNDLQGRQLFLHNKSVTPYPFIQNEKSTAVAYIPSLRKLIVATGRPREIFLASVADKTTNIIKKGFLITGIAVDDRKQTVFMTTRSPTTMPGVSVMTTKGKSFRSLVTMQCRIPGMIAADQKRSLIYVICSTKKQLLRYTYHGVREEDIDDTQMKCDALSIDVEADILYLCRKGGNQIFKMSLSDYSITLLTTLPKGVYSIFANNDKVYVSIYRTDYVLAINVHDLNTTAKFTTGYNKVLGVRMCIII